MNKGQLIDTVHAALGESATKACATKAVAAVLDSIATAIKAGEDVQIIGFGTFKTVDRKARQGKNPATGASIKIPASKSIKFKPSSALKSAVNSKKKAAKKK